MSHFSVLVIGSNVNEQLAPYHEFECTGQDDQFVQDVDVTSEIRELMEREEDPLTLEDALEYEGYEDRVVSSEEEVDRLDKHKYHYAIVTDGQLIKAVRRTNPNKQWDWYVVGGRWGGFFRLKPGKQGYRVTNGHDRSESKMVTGQCDSAFKGDIDFKGMADDARAEATARHRKIRGIVGDLSDFVPFDTFKTQSDGDTTKARDAYLDQPVLQRLFEARKATDDTSLFFVNVEDYLVSEHEYGERAADKSFATYAMLHEGKWYAKGEMGWFGMSSDNMTQDEWNAKVRELVEGLPDNTQLTIVDCHI